MEVERDWRRLGWGVLLILLGGIILLDRFEGLPEWALSFKWWPLILVAIGLLRLVGRVRPRDVGSAVTLVLMGGWFLLASNHWRGLEWRNSWPLALVAVGAGTVARALAARWLPDRRVVVLEEEQHA